MLESILIKNVATFDEPGVQINEFKKVNFIYGANGSGKTTISKLIDNPSDTLFSSCILSWRAGLPLKALVYNKDFRDTNFGEGNINGVFTIGKATKEEIETISKMVTELSAIKERGIKVKESLDSVISDKTKHTDTFRDELWQNVYKRYENVFKEAFRGFLQKELFKAEILNQFQNNSEIPKTYEELKEKADTIFISTRVLMQPISAIDFTRILEIENENIWKKKIIGKTDVEIAKLIQRLNINDWVNEGKSYLQEDTTCPFCQQPTITEDFRRQLEAYFDESFNIDTTLIKKLTQEYDRLTNNLLSILDGIESTEINKTETKLQTEKYSAYLKTLSVQFISNRELLKNKLKEPSRSIELIVTKEQLEVINQLITDANLAIEGHNHIIVNYNRERSDLIKAIWKYLIDEYRDKIRAFNKKDGGFQKGINALTEKHRQLQTDWSTLNMKIKEANKNVTSVQPSVDEINKILKQYGFTNFEIVPSSTDKNQYQIQREDKSIAQSTLSEGEITFITFLYFLQLAKGSKKRETVTEDRILVVDDPISSLDSTVLFVVSSLLKEIIKSIKNDEGNIKQLIILTHNVYFHKEVSFIDGRTHQNNETHFWILRRNNKISEIQPFGMNNPINTSYELLWKELKSNNSGITIQNVMRRIIENYFKLLGKYGDDQLIGKFPDKPEQEICRSLICWINDGSHSLPDDLYIENQESSIEKYKVVFKNIFYHMGHIEHYNMMMSDHQGN